jgi:hypothetical protein
MSQPETEKILVDATQAAKLLSVSRSKFGTSKSRNQGRSANARAGLWPRFAGCLKRLTRLREDIQSSRCLPLGAINNHSRIPNSC